MILSFLASALFRRIACSALISIAAYTIYKKIGDNAVDKARVKDQQVKIEKRKESLEKGKAFRKNYLKKKSENPVEGEQTPPPERIKNLFKRFQN